MSEHFSLTFQMSESIVVVINYEQRPKGSGCPTGERWAVIGLIENGTWREVIRIDNAPHRGCPAPHMHAKGKVVSVECKSYKEAFDHVVDVLKREYPERW